MKQSHTRKAGFAALAVTVGAGLAACGGGGGDGTPVVSDPFVPGTQVNVSATQSSDGAFVFANGSGAAQDNTGEPLVLGDATLATSETDEPKPL